MAKQLRAVTLITANGLVAAERAMDGRKYLVAPVVLLVEGVHNELLYPADVLATLPASWNGVPLTDGHPRRDGIYLSANSPDVLEEFGVGRVFNVHWDEGSAKLRGELWLDIERADAVNPVLVGMVRRGDAMEVSTGLWTTEQEERGEWHGEEYRAVVVAMHPDHLALLPDAIGACSWQDGCGVRANQGAQTEKGKAMNWKQFLAHARRIFSANGEISFDDIRESLQKAINALDTSEYVHWVRDVFDDTFVYEAWERGGGGGTMYRRDYTMDDESGEVTLADETIEVREERTYVPVANESDAGELSTMQRSPLVRADDFVRYVATNEKTCGCLASGRSDADAGDDGNPSVKEEGLMKKAEQVAALIANEKTQFTEDHKAWLETLTEDQLAALAPVEAPAAPAPAVATNEPRTEPAARAPEAPQTVDEYVANAPAEVSEYLKRVVANDRKRKDELVKSLSANEKCPFTETELAAKSLDELEKLAQWRGPQAVDYVGLAGGGDASPVANDENTMPVPDSLAQDQGQ